MSGKQQVNLLFGSDTFSLENAATDLIKKISPELDSSFGLERIDGLVSSASDAANAIDSTREAVLTRELLGGNKLVWLKNASFLDRSRLGLTKSVKDRLTYLTDLIKKGLPSGHFLLVTSAKIDKVAAFYRACKAHGHVEEFEQPQYFNQQTAAAESYLLSAARDAGLSISRDTLVSFYERAGTDRSVLRQEMAKLRDYMGDRKTITNEDIRIMVSPTRDYSIFELLEAVGQRNLKKALPLLKQMLFNGENPVGIIVMTESHFRQFALLKELDGKRMLER
ncbi:MAG: DNA polymerase III subunit delta, partial [Lentisphaerae bacterium]|nr:DNA polymerase III subunit delta [Lentisphaerota bacterium]